MSIRSKNIRWIWLVLGSLLTLGLRASSAAPPAPAGFGGGALDGSVSLVWTPEPQTTVYFLYRHGAGTATPTGTRTPLAVQSALTPTSYEDFQVTNGKSYGYLLSGWDGTEGPAAGVTFLPFGLPRPVEPLSVQVLRSESLDLTWTQPSSSFPVSYYQVFRHVITLTPTLTPNGSLTPTPTITRTHTPTGSPTFTSTSTPTGTLAPPPLQQTAVAAPPIATVLTTSFTDSTVSTPGPGLAYYVVRAVDDQGHLGDLPNSEAPSGVPQPGLPPAPPQLSLQVLATLTPTFGVRLSWSGPAASEGVTAYQVLSGSATLTVLPAATLTYDHLSPAFGNLPGSLTSYSVRALGVDGNTGSNGVSIDLYRSRINGAIQVTPGADGSVTLKWPAAFAGSYGFKGYRFYRGLFAAPASPVPAGSATPTATQTPTAFHTMEATPSITPTLVLTQGPGAHHGWRYWVEPFDHLGMAGTAPSPTPIYLRLAPTPPVNVAALGPLSGTNNGVDLSWSQASPGFYGTPTAYFIYRIPAAAPTPVFVTPVPYTEVSHRDYAPDPPGTELLYGIRVLDVFGNLSDLSSLAGPVTLGGSQPPEAPLGLSTTGDASSLRFGWLVNPPTDNVTRYLLYDHFPVDPATSTPVATMAPAATQTHIVPGLTVWNASFHYLVAQNADGFSAPATLSGVPVGPYSVLASAPVPTRAVSVSWDITPTPGSTPALDLYVIHRSASSGSGFVSIGVVPIGQNWFIDTSAPSAGTTFYYRVTLQANGGGLQAESPLHPTPSAEGSVLLWPQAPTGVAAIGGVGSVVLRWEANPLSEGVASYVLYRNGTPTAEATAVPSATMTWVFAESAGTTVSYSVMAQNSSGLSDASATVTGLAAPDLTPVLGLTPPPGAVETPGARSVWASNLSYSAGVDGYVLYRSTSLTQTPTPVATVSAPASFMRDGGLAGYVNQYRVVARSGGVEGGLYSSAQVPVTLWPNRPALAFDTSDSAVTLSWAAPAGDVPVTAYRVHRRSFGNLTPTPVATVLAPGTSYQDLGLSTGSSFHYWVEAEGPGGLSWPQPTPASALVKQPPVLAVVPGPSRNTLYWSGLPASTPAVAGGYQVFRAIPTPGTPGVFTALSGQLRTIGSPTPSFTDTGLLDGITYHYKVVHAGLNGAPLSGFSNEASGTVAFGPVTGLVAASGDGAVQLRWEFQGTPGNNYILMRKLGTAPEVPSSYVTIQSGIQGTGYLDQGLANKTYFTYRIVTVNPGGQAVTSAPAEALPAKPPILSSEGVTITQDQNGNTLTFWPANCSLGTSQWNDLYDPSSMYPIGGYRVYKSLDGGTYQLVGTAPVPPASIPVSPVTFQDAGATVIGGSTLTYLVRAFDAPPGVDLSDPLLVHETPYDGALAKGLLVSTALDRNAIRPNGALNEQSVNIRLVLESQQKVVIKVFTLSGTFVKKILDQDLPKGVYGLPGSPVPINWDATNMNGTPVASGVYLIATEMGGGHREFRKVAVIR